MNVVSVPEMVASEEEAFRGGVTASALMDAAGAAMAARILELYPKAESFLILVGKGNNGGDGLVVAEHLAAAGKPVQVVLAAAEKDLGELPRARLQRLRKSGAKATIVEWSDRIAFPGSRGVVIDALLGLQARGALRGTVAEIAAVHNAARESRFFRTVALDLPSGLGGFEENATPARDAAIVADLTLAVGFAKEALVRETAAAWVGRLQIVPWTWAPLPPSPRQVLVPHELATLLPRRSAASYKGDYGHLVIVAGSAGFSGAPLLCLQAAQAIGAGLLSVVTKPEITAIVAAHAPAEAMVSGWEGDATPPVLEKASAIVFGPGLGADERTAAMLRAVLALGRPVLIDADGLNVLAKNPALWREMKAPVVLTPHVGEMARLIGRKFKADEREKVARELTGRHDVTLVLKGTRTLITAQGEPFFINTSGNAGLSTGGSGDTLSGVIGGLLAQGLKSLDAARLGVWLHGHAADLVLSERGCEEGLTPTMLSAHLGTALVSLRAQAVARVGLLEQAKQMPG
jgi:NAD(P)H-hydrate epimerase